jgi:hypothetical protein
MPIQVDPDVEVRITHLLGYLRPAAIWAGISAFFLGSLLLGQVLAADAATSGDFGAAALFVAVGVGLVGAGLASQPTEGRYDPEIEFAPWQRHAVGGTSLGFLLLALVIVLLG